MIKLALVGAGIIGVEHLKALSRCKDFELVAICDVNEVAASKLAAEYNVPYFLDYTQIPQKSDAEAVLLNLPHFLHRDAAVFFLEAGLDVFLEKPMAISVRECDEMLQAAQKSGKRLAVGHLQRFFAANRVVKDYVKNEALGKLFAVNELRSIRYFTEKRPAWFLKKALSGGGIVMNYGAHMLDKLLYITDSDISHAVGVCGNLLPGIEVEGHAQFFVQTESGVSATVTFSGYSKVGYETTYYFEKGSLKVTNGVALSICRDGVWEELATPADEDFMLLQLCELAKYFRGEPSETPDGVYAKKIVAAIEQIYR